MSVQEQLRLIEAQVAQDPSSADLAMEMEEFSVGIGSANLLDQHAWSSLCLQAEAIVYGYTPYGVWTGVEPQKMDHRAPEKEHIDGETVRIGRKKFTKSLNVYTEVILSRLEEREALLQEWGDRDDFISNAFGGDEDHGLALTLSTHPYFRELLYEVPEIVLYAKKTYPPSRRYTLPELPTPSAMTIRYLHETIGSRIIPDSLEHDRESGAVHESEFELHKKRAFNEQAVVYKYHTKAGMYSAQRIGLTSSEGTCFAKPEEIYTAVSRIFTIFSVYRPLVFELFKQLEAEIYE